MSARAGKAFGLKEVEYPVTWSLIENEGRYILGYVFDDEGRGDHPETGRLFILTEEDRKALANLLAGT